MTTYFPFTPTSQATFTFQPVLDGQTYQGIVTWSLFGQRYYVNIYTLNNVLVFALPLITSLPAFQLASLTWNLSTQQVTVTTVSPHGVKLGKTVAVTIAGVSPSGYNGAFDALATGPSTFTYPMTTPLDAMTQTGTGSFLVSITAGYFDSTMVYRNGNIEVSP